MNPLINDLSNVKDQDLQTQISELTKKYFMTSNPGLQTQIANLLDMYNEELSIRNAKQWMDQQNNSDKGLDKLINVS